MKKQFFSFILILSFVFNAAAQKAQTDASEKNLRAHVEYLASDKLQGRRTGEEGATFAAGYVANTFANYKLKAGVSKTIGGKTKTNFLQEFPFVTDSEIGKGNSMSLLRGGKSDSAIKMKVGTNWMPAAFSPNAEIGNTQVVFAGYGIASDEQKYDDYKNLDINGRIILALDGLPDGVSLSSLARYADARVKAKIAKDKGAIALILISREQNFKDDKLAALKYDPTLGESAVPTLVVSRRIGAAMLGIDEADLTTEQKKLFPESNNPNSETSISKLNDFKSVAGFKINLVKKQTEAYNVIGVLEGSDANLKNEAIIIGAHYDHLGHGGQGSLAVNSKEIHHGADDNASGVAAMLELARQFAEAKNNRRTLIFIAFGGEEEGLLGSKFYVNNPVFPLDKTVAMINMDMIGRLKDEKLTIGGIGTAGEWKGLVENENFQLGSITHVEVLSSPQPNVKTEDVIAIAPRVPLARISAFNLQLNEDGFGPSDHSSFYSKQIPVLFFFTGSHEDYHKPTDTADKINYEGLLKVTNFVGEIVNLIDRNPQKPTYSVAKSAGMGEGRRGFNVSLGTVPSYAEGTNDGLLLDGVRDDSPAAKAGIAAGDKIIKLAGSEIRNISDYVYVLGEMKAGEEYEIVVLRGGKPLTLKIVPAARTQR